MYILGLNTYHGDASAAIFRDGELLAGVEEERFTRIKHTAGFPCNAIRYCLAVAGIDPAEIDHIAIPRKRSAHILRKALWAARLPHMAFSRGRAWRRFGDLNAQLAACLDVPSSRIQARLHFVEHHVSHVASSFYASPFDQATILSLDGLGDFASMLWGTGSDRDLNVEGYVFFPHSLGFLYTAVTQYLGFWKYGDEYKVMGLGAYGEPKYMELFDRMVRLGRDTDFSLDLRYFTHHRDGSDVTWMEGEPKQGQLFSEHMERALGPARTRADRVAKVHEDVAASLQLRLEQVVLALLNRLGAKSPVPNLCYGGGVAFNCVANGKILDQTPFEQVYIQSAAGDAGLAIGAALYVYHQVLGCPRKLSMDHSYWGPEFGEDRLREAIERRGLTYRTLDRPDLIERTARRIADGNVVGLFQGRSEWGPRALGNRSIVADPRRPEMKDILNARVKHREPFRPFAPSILEERTGEWFEQEYPSPFMLMAYSVLPDKQALIPAPTHIDGTGRLQTVSHRTNPFFWELIREFEKLTGVPALLNTSFNENEPIVNTPEQALDCFLRTRIDDLALGPFLVERKGDVSDSGE